MSVNEAVMTFEVIGTVKRAEFHRHVVEQDRGIMQVKHFPESRPDAEGSHQVLNRIRADDDAHCHGDKQIDNRG